MLKSEFQHQFWLTKKVVQRKLGIKKEDECIVSSDSELDAKIELFLTISESSNALYHILDQYQERLCIVAQEENALGKFLKEAGKNSNTTGKIMINSGKAISYSGQIRMTMRPPILRLHHEVEVFRDRAVEDTSITISLMEKERTEYRAALSWIKSISAQLDPDTGRGLEKFRKAQNLVRNSKAKFDRLSLDCLQKIDLLAAARCSMYSQALVSYMSALLQFFTKSSDTYQAAINTLMSRPQYNFSILKDLTQQPSQQPEDIKDNQNENIKAIDSDQMLFFLDDYTDKKTEQSQNDGIDKGKGQENKIFDNKNAEIIGLMEKIPNEQKNLVDIDGPSTSTAGLVYDNKKMKNSNFDLLLENLQFDLFLDNNSLTDPNQKLQPLQQFTPIVPEKTDSNKISESSATNKKSSKKLNKSKDKMKDMSSWYKLFSELDPFEDMEKKIAGSDNNNCQSA